MVPFLTEAIHRTDMSSSEVFMAVVESIKATAEVPPNATVRADDGQVEQGEESGATGAGQEDATDNILKQIGGPYEKILRFIWASYHHSGEVKAPVIASLQDEETVQWETEVQKVVEPTPAPRDTVDLTEQAEMRGGNTEGALTALTKLSECIAKQQEAATKAQDEKKDPMLKAWNKLPHIQNNIILLGGGAGRPGH